MLYALVKRIIFFSLIGFFAISAIAQSDPLSFEQLTKTQQNLVEKAIESMTDAYAPYSHYHVGAALLSEDGTIFTGFNIENASYGLTVCAERTALFKAVTSHHKKFTQIAVVTKNGGMPCGACRQTLNEFSPELLVIVTDANKTKIQLKKLSELLPDSFGPNNLT